MSIEQPRNALPGNFQLGNYLIVNTLGQGGFGITYLAKDIQLEAEVAIKEYLPNDLAFRETDSTVKPKTRNAAEDFHWGLTRFIQEARILAKCKHPNIVMVLRYFENNNTAYLVMDYEKGRGMDDILTGGQTLSAAKLNMLLPPLTDSLRSVHEAGYLHRDIKPGNIYIRDYDNSPVLLDFGSARLDVGKRSKPMTAMVSEGYSPFEQYHTDTNEQGPWTDIYAMGGVLYRMISGKIPVQATNRISAVLQGDPDPLVPAVEVGANRYPPSLLEAIDWALAVKQEDRPQTVDEWQVALFAQHSPYSIRNKRIDPVQKSGPSRQRASRGRTEPGRKANRFLALSVIILLGLILTGGVGYLLWVVTR